MPNVEKYNDRVARFRRYLAATPISRDGKLTGETSGVTVASDEIKRFKEDGFNRGLFREHRRIFVRWWEAELSGKRSESGTAGVAEKKRLASKKTGQ
jgi:hypothetical protein